MIKNILKNIPPEISRYIYRFLNPISCALTSETLMNINWCSQCGEFLLEHYLNKTKDDYICLPCFYLNKTINH